MSGATLKLVDDRDLEKDVLPMERRGSMRHQLTGSATCLSEGPNSINGLRKISSVQLWNISDTGLGAISAETWEVDSNVTIFFSPHGPDGGFELVGRVVRCRLGDQGHEVGVQFDGRSAA